jgi:hypothetical protein
MGPRAWYLNVDADLELGTRGPYTPSDRVRRAAEAPSRVIANTLVPPGDRVVANETTTGELEGLEGRCFCPTPNARARLRELGVVLPAAPTVDVLRKVARRDFSYREELPGSFASTDLERVVRALAGAAPLGDGWRLKRAYGMASRGHRIVRGPLGATDVAFVRASTDGLIVEPNVSIRRELGLHGFLRADGTYVAGAPTEQEMDAYGAWRETRTLAAGALDATTLAALESSLERAALALHAASYFGPFGIDAFEYEVGAGNALRLRECSEIHARYSMGWAFGFPNALTRPDL